ncbi:MAG TPA: NERD domain-containing protein [Candidatus Acidoferrales bacterium]|nr:NERD domain-containing protein [Candidatus Acidoferrales bacterium]
MKVSVFACGPAANESEVLAVDHLKRQLQNAPGDDCWILLTNLAFSVTHQLQSDEIDIVAIGPPGVRVIEVKHWSQGWVDTRRDIVEAEANKATNKARKIGTTLRRIAPDLPCVDGAFLLTQPASKVKRLSGRPVHGVTFHTLNQWKDAIGFDGPRVLSASQVSALAQVLEPKVPVAIDGSLRRLAGYVNLELQSPREQKLHRVYKGSHPARRDRVVLHLYDLSASDDTNAETKARREAETLQRLQLHSWAPRILDSWQNAPGYAGEMCFFTIVDPAAPPIEDRAADESWTPSSRLLFARDAVRALAQFHSSAGPGEPLVHRNLTPQTILVRYDNSPIFTGFDRTRIPSDVSVASSNLPTTSYPEALAPEIQLNGLAAADQRSDIYSLCACLSRLFEPSSDGMSAGAVDILATGMAVAIDERAPLSELDRSLSELLGDSIEPPPPPPARFWTEDQLIRFRDRDYRIVTRLGSGGIGTAFKVVEVDRVTKEDMGTYVAKVAHESETGKLVLRAYSLARSHLGRHESLSPIYEVATDWQENQFVSLLGWVDGAPLNDFTGVLPLLAEDWGEISTEAVAIGFLEQICEALDILHRNGLTHGDISPKNIILSNSNVVLTDYDFVARIGDASTAPGTVAYSSPARDQKLPAAPRDDLFAAAASLFHVLFEKEPFWHGGELAKERGLNWNGVERAQCPKLAAVLDKAVHPDPEQRFASASDMLSALRACRAAESRGQARGDQDASPPSESDAHGASPLSEQRIEWLKSLLQSYPGSRWGNRETRGLDTSFASDTYVSTALEKSLLDDIRDCRVRLVILCGNAGDGKTALLQHLAQQLGLGRHPSANRILEGRVPNGPRIRMNLDGSAAWRGKSADQILDDFLEPFQEGPPKENIVHLLAINDGRLLEWIIGVEERRGGETSLTAELYELLREEAATTDSYVRFINLNQRSVVGGITADRGGIDTSFLQQLLDHLYGGARASEIWSPCQACSAQDRCTVFAAARVFGPDGLKSPVRQEVRERARRRLFEAIQAVHLRGETHITVRELRAALVYILFGVHFCDDYHSGDEHPLPYWDRAFAAQAPARQGEVLRELTQLDPALESHPQIDRYVLSHPAGDSGHTAPHYEDQTLESARRRAFFEWTQQDLTQVAADAEALDLARGRHLKLFRELPLKNDPHVLAEITARLCEGISRLEDLPPLAFERPRVVPLQITQRTLTETAFWVEKPLEKFYTEADLPSESGGVERLHRQAFLVYRYRDGNEERLRLGAELFHLLLELGDGFQLGDVSTDDTFAHLSIFVQRLIREDERELFAWNPMRDDQVYRVTAAVRNSERNGPLQRIEISQAEVGADQ